MLGCPRIFLTAAAVEAGVGPGGVFLGTRDTDASILLLKAVDDSTQGTGRWTAANMVALDCVDFDPKLLAEEART